MHAREIARRAALALILTPASLGAQAGYYNLDAGRPTRVEDAVPVERFGLDVQLAPSRFERLDGGALRWRTEPKISFGLLPLTEIEVRVPVVYSRAARGGASTFGASGIGVGALHALTIEAGRTPALAVAGEVLLPAGSVAGSDASFSLRALVTRTTVMGRLHLNATAGTYALPAPRAATTTTGVTCPPGFVPAPAGGCIPSIPDPPCLITGAPARDVEAVPEHVARQASASPPAPRTTGTRWMAGIAGDHAFALQSTLVSMDVFVERFAGPYRATEWTAEGGARRQWSPRLVTDAGVSRRFTGRAPAFSFTLGATWALARRPRR